MKSTIADTVITVILTMVGSLTACQSGSNHLVLSTKVFQLKLTADKASRCSPYIILPDDVPCVSQRIIVTAHPDLNTLDWLIPATDSLSIRVDGSLAQSAHGKSNVAVEYYASNHLESGRLVLLKPGQRLQACAADTFTRNINVDLMVINNPA